MSSPDLVRQLHIIHLSDLHFGDDHRFNTPVMVDGDVQTRPGYPTLFQKLMEDFAEPTPIENLILCITGDFASNPTNFHEFERAAEFVNQLAKSTVHGKERGLGSIYMVPGNHDVNFAGATMGERWERYISFVNRIFQKNLDYDRPIQTVTLDDRTADLGALILCLNSSIHVQRGTPNEQRGEVDHMQLTRVQELLEKFDREKGRDLRERSIRIALIHHHPVLIPDLAEPGRGYDAVANSGQLIRQLREFRFHLILHGHKHSPYVFTEDSQSAWTTDSQPIVIAAGGSTGSRALPEEFEGRTNCYNRITIKWHPSAGQTRVYIETRGLNLFRSDRREDLANNWKWGKLREYDKVFLTANCIPSPSKNLSISRGMRDSPTEGKRVSEYSRLRGNMPVVEVMPSLIINQAYEARVWLVPHQKRELPCEVVWSAGPKHDAISVSANKDEWFCASFHYWGPMLLQARLLFSDGSTETAHIYARLPEDCSKTEKKEKNNG